MTVVLIVKSTLVGIDSPPFSSSLHPARLLHYPRIPPHHSQTHLLFPITSSSGILSTSSLSALHNSITPSTASNIPVSALSEYSTNIYIMLKHIISQPLRHPSIGVSDSFLRAGNCPELGSRPKRGWVVRARAVFGWRGWCAVLKGNGGGMYEGRNGRWCSTKLTSEAPSWAVVFR